LQEVEVPELHAGDRLSRAEFERRYDATPNLKKAELIEGIVYMAPPPVSHTYHSNPHFNLMRCLGRYCDATPGISGGDNGSLRLDLDNEPQPDAYLLINTDRGGNAKIDGEGYVLGAPELIAEIAYSSVSYDLHAKMNVYRRNGVREYVVWRTQELAMDYFVLRNGEYRELPDVDGVFKSEVFPGLWINAKALLEGDILEAVKTVQQGTASVEHADFVKRLTGQSQH